MTKSLVAAGIALFAGAFLLAQEGDYQRGLSYYKQKQYAKAIEEFERIVGAAPDYEAGYRVLGDSYLRLKDYEGAIRSFQNALRLKTDVFVSYYGLAVSYYNVGRLEEAVSTLDRGAGYARSPGQQYQLHSTRGLSHHGLGDFQKAAEDLEKAVSIQRGDLRDVLHLGIAHYQLGNLQEAEEYLTRALSLDPEAVEAKTYLSRLRYKEGMQAFQREEYRRAADLLARYVGAFPGDGPAHFNLGLAQLFAGNLAEAARRFEESSRLMPDHWESHDRLGYVREKLKQYDRALASYRKAQALQPSAPLRQSVERVEERLRRAESRR